MVLRPMVTVPVGALAADAAAFGLDSGARVGLAGAQAVTSSDTRTRRAPQYAARATMGWRGRDAVWNATFMSPSASRGGGAAAAPTPGPPGACAAVGSVRVGLLRPSSHRDGRPAGVGRALTPRTAQPRGQRIVRLLRVPRRRSEIAARAPAPLLVERGQLTSANMPLVTQVVAFERLRARAQDLAGVAVVVQHGAEPELLDGADAQAHRAAVVAADHRDAALGDGLVLEDAAPVDPDFRQGSPRAALHADLALLADHVDAVVDRLVAREWGIGGEAEQRGARAEQRRQ